MQWIQQLYINVFMQLWVQNRRACAFLLLHDTQSSWPWRGAPPLKSNEFSIPSASKWSKSINQSISLQWIYKSYGTTYFSSRGLEQKKKNYKLKGFQSPNKPPLSCCFTTRSLTGPAGVVIGSTLSPACSARCRSPGVS